MPDYALVANPNKNYYTTRKNKVRLIVVHVTAGLQDLDMIGPDHSARNTNRYGATTSTKASWHSCVDSDSIDPALPDEYTAFHCVNYNSMSLGIEISNRDARWDNKPDAWVQATLLNAAKVCKAWCDKFDIPVRLLSRDEVDSGGKGFTYHSRLDPARRTDPGATFPWHRFAKILESLDGGSTTDTDTEEFVMDAKTTKQMQDLLRKELKTVLGERTKDRRDTDPAHISLSDVYTQQERFEMAVAERLTAFEAAIVTRIQQLEDVFVASGTQDPEPPAEV